MLLFHHEFSLAVTGQACYQYSIELLALMFMKLKFHPFL